ncbi:MAG: ribonuclease J [Acidobacteriia bacterium]|nr:ribonuclease J [Terriglobia bacterium]
MTSEHVTDGEGIEVVALGGLGEFGMNMMAIRYRGNILIIDAGLMFPRDELLGVDLVIPDLSYILERRDEVRAVVLTHGHEDHIGALPFLLREIAVPVYGTPLTLGFARGRLAEQEVLDRADLRSIQPRDTIEIAGMTLEFLGVTHSVADAVGVALTTPLGTIVHTGDFKFDQSPPDQQLSDYARLSSLGDQGVLALFSDSTNSERPGYTPSESHVRQNLEQIFHITPGKIIVACFASSSHRIQIILDLAQDFGRKVVPVGRSMVQNVAISRELGYLSVPPDLLLSTQEAQHLPPEELVLLSTGSQGEPVSALSRLALGKHKDYSVEADDAVIFSARAIPGNETRISHLINHFCRRGAKIYNENHSMVHVSGHASQEELKLMLNLIRPRFFVPIHGEYRQLFNHALIAEETGVPWEHILLAETGDIISLTPDAIGVQGRAPVGRRLIDAGSLAELDELVVKDRQHLSEEGVVLAVVPINKATGLIEGMPELVSRGHIQEAGGSALMAEARQVILSTVEECSNEERVDAVVLSEMVRADLKRFFRKRTATRPMIVPVILEI